MSLFPRTSAFDQVPAAPAPSTPADEAGVKLAADARVASDAKQRLAALARIRDVLERQEWEDHDALLEVDAILAELKI